MTIETKYNIGDEVWFLAQNAVWNCKVDGIYISIREDIQEDNRIVYEFCNNNAYGGVFSVYEKALFPTKEELLKSL